MTAEARRGYSFLAGGLLCMVWVLLCPTYTIHGSTSYVSTHNSSWQPGVTWNKEQEFCEPGALWGGFVVIWSLVGASYYLLPIWNLGRIARALNYEAPSEASGPASAASTPR